MMAQRAFGFALVVAAFVAILGCSTGSGGDTQNGGSVSETPGSIVGQVPATVTPIDDSLASNQSSIQSSGLAPSSPNGTQSAGIVNADGTFPGAVPLMMPNGQYFTGQFFPNFRPPAPTFSNPQILKFFLCISLVSPYNNGIAAPTAQQLIQRWNLVMSWALKLAGRLFRPTEMAQHLKNFVNADSVTERQNEAWRIIMSRDHIETEVAVVYNTFLRRDPSADEVTTWFNQFNNSGLKYKDFVVKVAASPERQNLVGGNGVNARITNMIADTYAKVLGRLPSKKPAAGSELNYWFRFVNNQRSAGKSYGDAITMMVDGIVGSQENYRKIAEVTVKNLYEANDANLIKQAYDQLVANGGDLFAVMKWLLGTEEYKSKFWLKYVQSLTADWCNANAGDFFQQWFH